MRFHLYHCLITRSGKAISGHLVASSQEHAQMVIDAHERALGLTHDWCELLRVDETLPDQLRDGLDHLLETAPAGFVSHCGLGWVPHVAPVHKLRLFRSEDYRGMEILAVAPDASIAAALFLNTQLREVRQRHRFVIEDVTDSLPGSSRAAILSMLETGPVGIADFDEETGRWFIW